MKKVYKLENLDCANCARKMEEAINKIEGVDKATISFMTQKLTIESSTENFEALVDEAQKAISKVEKDCIIKK